VFALLKLMALRMRKGRKIGIMENLSGKKRRIEGGGIAFFVWVKYRATIKDCPYKDTCL